MTLSEKGNLTLLSATGQSLNQHCCVAVEASVVCSFCVQAATDINIQYNTYSIYIYIWNFVNKTRRSRLAKTWICLSMVDFIHFSFLQILHLSFQPWRTNDVEMGHPRPLLTIVPTSKHSPWPMLQLRRTMHICRCVWKVSSLRMPLDFFNRDFVWHFILGEPHKLKWSRTTLVEVHSRYYHILEVSQDSNWFLIIYFIPAFWSTSCSELRVLSRKAGAVLCATSAFDRKSFWWMVAWIKWSWLKLGLLVEVVQLRLVFSDWLRIF